MDTVLYNYRSAQVLRFYDIWVSGKIRELLGKLELPAERRIDEQVWLVTRRRKEITSSAEMRANGGILVLIELKTKPDPGATAVAVIPVWVALVPIVMVISPIIVRAIVPIVLARGITMMARPDTILLFAGRSGFSLDRKNRQRDADDA